MINERRVAFFRKLIYSVTVSLILLHFVLLILLNFHMVRLIRAVENNTASQAYLYMPDVTPPPLAIPYDTPAGIF